MASKNYPDAVKYLGLVTGEESHAPAFLLQYGKACYNVHEEQSKALTIYKQLALLLPDNADVFRRSMTFRAKSEQRTKRSSA